MEINNATIQFISNYLYTAGLSTGLDVDQIAAVHNVPDIGDNLCWEVLRVSSENVAEVAYRLGPGIGARGLVAITLVDEFI